MQKYLSEKKPRVNWHIPTLVKFIILIKLKNVWSAVKKKGLSDLLFVSCIKKSGRKKNYVIP